MNKGIRSRGEERSIPRIASRRTCEFKIMDLSRASARPTGTPPPREVSGAVHNVAYRCVGARYLILQAKFPLWERCYHALEISTLRILPARTLPHPPPHFSYDTPTQGSLLDSDRALTNKSLARLNTK
jgi:hypothetical protein